MIFKIIQKTIWKKNLLRVLEHLQPANRNLQINKFLKITCLNKFQLKVLKVTRKNKQYRYQ